MDEVMPKNWQQSVSVRYALGVLGIVALSLLIFNLLMRPPFSDFGLMALFLSITALVSGMVGYGSYRLGWMQRSPTIRWTLLGGYLLSSVLTFLNVWVTANLMFFDQHDLLLATVLLLFASGMAMALGYFLSSTLTDRIRLLDRAARLIAGGNLGTRLPVSGNDELAVLATTFNQMASQLQEAARKKEELEALRRDLIAWAGHDLQTPLASIQAILEALRDGVVEEPETAQRYLHTAQKDVSSLSSLIDDLFQMTQLDTGGLPLNLENISLSDLISDTLESFSQVAARQGVQLTGKVSADVDPVVMDAQRVGRVLNNLVSNALRHTPSGGSISVRATRIPSGVRVEVLDNGEGIPAHDLPHIFERFYRGEKSRSRLTGGAGLGLAIARGMVEAHGGNIGLESQPGETLFFFQLPGQSG